jgi:hypothetical protein
MCPMEHALLSQEQFERLVGLPAGIRASVGLVHQTQNNNETVLFVEALHCGHAPYKHKAAWHLHPQGSSPTQTITMQLQKMLPMNTTWKNNPRRRIRSMSPGNGSKLTNGIGRTIPSRTSRRLFARSLMSLTCPLTSSSHAGSWCSQR